MWQVLSTSLSTVFNAIVLYSWKVLQEYVLYIWQFIVYWL